MMKKNVLVAAIAAGLFTVVACKKETTVTTDTDGLDTTTFVVEEEYVVDPAVQAEVDQAQANYEKAEADVQEAIRKGDKKAEEAAIKVRDEAKNSWDNLKAGVNKAADDVKGGINNAASKVEESAEKVGDKAKEVGKDIEDGYNNTLDKMKTNK
ncbi:MAG: hypothetical protein Q4G18_02015 [Myroides sp.]|jgi:hypothetical protein|nr:hypothetical protein [uncultured Flavobacterium sp.]MDO5636012.1 hypothetical protein [Myroides sp.]